MNLQTDNATLAGTGQAGALAANVLRILGAAATVFGAVIFMLQGFDHIELSWRPWFYLAFIALLGAGGLASLHLFRDARGARLFLALAAALVPVQFTQLGGMLYALLHESASPVPGIFQSGVVTAAQTAVVAGVSVLVLAAASWAGFVILVRPYARSLGMTFLAVCVLLLLPERASPIGMLVLVAQAGVFLWLETHRFRVAPEFATWEGWAVRLMFVMPLCITAVRAAFYLHDLTMYAMLFSVAGGFLLLTIRAEFRTWIAEAMRAVASACLIIAWLLLALEVFSLGYDYLWFAVVFPMGVVLLAVGHFAPRSGVLYRWLGMALITLASYALIDAADEVFAWLIVCAIGAGLCATGAYYRERTPVIIGALQAAIALFGIVALSLRAFDVDTWLVLAGAGIALVLLSSAAERYGLPVSRIRRFVRGRGDD
ncbi:MAG: hypothetical protein OET44_12585 [Gammaproteobacteria bacterium]|nr:hypothetical protein [Gammaproteobacteria bacterium]